MENTKTTLPCKSCLLDMVCTQPCKDIFDSREYLLNELTKLYDSHFVVTRDNNGPPYFVLKNTANKKISRYFNSVSETLKVIDKKFSTQGWLDFFKQNHITF